jgi:hypothetical protein
MSQLSKSDYIRILTFYKKEIPKTFELIKKEAHDILATKLCKCIKKVDKMNESKSIGICTKTIFNRKGLTRGDFKCRSKRFVKFNNTRTNKRA